MLQNCRRGNVKRVELDSIPVSYAKQLRLKMRLWDQLKNVVKLDVENIFIVHASKSIICGHKHGMRSTPWHVLVIYATHAPVIIQRTHTWNTIPNCLSVLDALQHIIQEIIALQQVPSRLQWLKLSVQSIFRSIAVAAARMEKNQEAKVILGISMQIGVLYAQRVVI